MMVRSAPRAIATGSPKGFSYRQTTITTLSLSPAVLTSLAPFVLLHFISAQIPCCPERDGRRYQTRRTASHNGQWSADQRGYRAGFDFAQLRTSHEKNHIDGGHAPAQLIRRSQLANGLAQDCTNSVRTPGYRQHQQREPKHSRQTKRDRRDAKNADRDNYQKPLLFPRTKPRHHQA